MLCETVPLPRENSALQNMVKWSLHRLLRSAMPLCSVYPVLHYVMTWKQGGHQPGKPGKVGEFDSGQGKVRESGKSPENMFCLWCFITIAMATE